MDVVARLGRDPALRPVSSGDSGSFARRLAPASRWSSSFRPADAMLYEAEADSAADAEAVGELAPATPAELRWS